MIRELHVENFKAWRDTGDIRLAPITVLFGGNSAGKSSIPQLLLMLKQTAESTDRRRVLNLGGGKGLVDLGTFEDIVYRHETERHLAFWLSWEPLSPLQVVDPLSGTAVRGDILQFDARIQAGPGAQLFVESMIYSVFQEPRATYGDRGDVELLDIGMKRLSFENRYVFTTNGFDVVPRPGREAATMPPPERFYGFPDEAIAFYQNTGFVADLALSLEQVLKGIHYLGPLREHPKRSYLWSGEAVQHVGERGEGVIEAVLGGSSRKFSYDGQHELSLPELTAHRLRRMGLIHDFRVQPLGPGRKEYEVILQVGAKTAPVRLTDVGFGVSQVLPVIVECFCVPKNSTVVFEQPELHLHPRAQSDLADLFIDAIRALEDGEARNLQLIIESHSEHLLHRLRRRIAEGALRREDVAIYFVNQDDGEARLAELDVDEFGNILNWPQDFFGNPMEDLVAQAEAQAKRMVGR